MSRAERLGQVEKTAYIPGRGLIVHTENWQSRPLEAGDWIEFRSTQGRALKAKVESATRVEAVHPGDPTVHETNRFAVLLPTLGRQDAEQGDGIWSVPEPPPEMIPPETPVAPSPWWRRWTKG